MQLLKVKWSMLPKASSKISIVICNWQDLVHDDTFLPYSHHFSLGLTQCGPDFTLCLTDRSGNCTTESANLSRPGYAHIHRFIQALSHITLAPDEEIDDDHFFQTFGGSFQMKFPNAPNNDHHYLKDLTIVSQLFHAFIFTGKGTHIRKKGICHSGIYSHYGCYGCYDCYD